MRQSPPNMVLNLPAHTQKQLAYMAGSPPPSPSPQATPYDQYRLTLASRYRQQIQQIMDADLLAQDPDAIIPAGPITTTTTTTTSQIPTRLLRSDLDSTSDSDSDDSELLPPYVEDDGSSSDCTITVQEIDSPDTPSDTSDPAEPSFFTNYTASPHMPPPALVAEIQPKRLSRPVIVPAKKPAVSVSEKPCHSTFSIRPRSRDSAKEAAARPASVASSHSGKMRRQLAAIFSGSIRSREHGKAAAPKPTVTVREAAWV